MNRICFLDLETTGLDPDRHEPWEIGLIARGHYDGDREFLWRVRPDLTKADPNSLRIGRYYERTTEHESASLSAANLAARDSKPKWSSPEAVAVILARLLDGAHIVGAVPSFDAAFLRRWLPRYGQAFTAHYHLIDVETLAVGWLLGAKVSHFDATPPWKSDDLSLAVGVDPADFDRHTALGDARWVRAQWDAITGGGSG